MTELASLEDLGWYVNGLRGVSLQQISGSYNHWVFFVSEDECGLGVSEREERIRERLVGDWIVEGASLDDVEYYEMPAETVSVLWISPPKERE